MRKKDSILEAYQKSKKNTDTTLSEKIMEISKAGKPNTISKTMTCIFCDAADVCETCDAWDFHCGGGDIICISRDSCDIEFNQ
jgi:hypothetical protein